MNRLLLGSVALSVVMVSYGATMRYWVGGDGNWSDTTHWKDGNKPANGEAAQFPNDLGPITVTMDEDSAALAYFTIEDQAEGGQPNAVTLVGSGRFGQSKDYTSNNTIGNGRKLIVDGPRVETSNNIFVGTNAVLELRSGEFITRKASGSNGVCLRQGAVVNVTGGQMSISAIVNDNAADEGAFGSIFRVAGGSVEIFSTDAFASHFHPDWTEFRFDGGEVIANKRLAYANRYLLPPKGGVFCSSSTSDCEGECKDVPNGVYEIGGSVVLTNREAAYFTVNSSGTALIGGGSLTVPTLTFGVYQGTAAIDLSAVNLGTGLNSSSYSGEIAINDGLTLGCWNDICVGGNKDSDFNVVGPLTVDTLDCFDRTTPHAVQLQQWFDFSRLTDFEAKGGGMVTVNSEVAAKYLHDFKLDAGTTLDLSANANDKIVADRLVLGANSVLKVGANAVSAAVGQTVDPTAEVWFAFPVETFEAGGRYLLWESPYGMNPPLSNFRFDPALPEGWFVTNVNGVAWISDGMVHEADAETKHYWLGLAGGNWNVKENWGAGSIPGKGISLAAYFSGDRQLAVTNDVDMTLFRNVIFRESSGPYVISGKRLTPNYSGSSATYSNESPFPQRIEALATYSTSNPPGGYINILSQGGSSIELVGGGEFSDYLISFRGDVRLGGVWNIGSVAPYSVSANSRPTRVSVLPGATVNVLGQDWVGADSNITITNQAYYGIYNVHESATMNVAGELWRWARYENVHFVDGTLNVSCPMQTAVKQTFRGAGEINLACARSDTSAVSEFKFADAVTVRPAGWITVREGADNPLRMIVRDNVTIGANADWSYGPAADFASATDATDRALVVEGGAKSRVTFDTQSPADATVGHVITFTDPIRQSRFSTLIKTGAGTLKLSAEGNEFADVELKGGALEISSVQAFDTLTFDGGKIALAGDLAVAAKAGKTVILTAKKLTGDVELDGNYSVVLSESLGNVTVSAKEHAGSVLVVR